MRRFRWLRSSLQIAGATPSLTFRIPQKSPKNSDGSLSRCCVSTISDNVSGTSGEVLVKGRAVDGPSHSRTSPEPPRGRAPSLNRFSSITFAVQCPPLLIVKLHEGWKRVENSATRRKGLFPPVRKLRPTARLVAKPCFVYRDPAAREIALECHRGQVTMGRSTDPKIQTDEPATQAFFIHS